MLECAKRVATGGVDDAAGRVPTAPIPPDVAQESYVRRGAVCSPANRRARVDAPVWPMKESPRTTSSHTIACFDRGNARILQFGSAQAPHRMRPAELHVARGSGEASRSQGAFFADVCDALDEVDEILVVGGCGRLADFRRFVENHRRSLASSITAYDVADEPTDRQLVALARRRFPTFGPQATAEAPVAGRKNP